MEKKWETEEIKEINDMYTRLSIYFSLDEAKRTETRQDLPLPESAKDFTDEELFYLHTFLGTYISSVILVKHAVSQINSLPDPLSKKIGGALIEILKGTLGPAVEVYNQLTKK